MMVQLRLKRLELTSENGYKNTERERRDMIIVVLIIFCSWSGI